MTIIRATVVLDSISPAGKRIVTIEAIYPRFIHSEVLTHKDLSRNAASSRAIPVKRMLQDIRDNPAMPIHWGKNQPGMQAMEEVDEASKEFAKTIWMEACHDALKHAQRLSDIGIHKQAANRVVEPFMHMRTILTATNWDNELHLRCAWDAQPEFKALAEAKLAALNESDPVLLKPGQWHLPYLREGELEELGLETARKCSVARCARVSFLNHDGSDPDIAKDIRLHDLLWKAPHATPFEHQATPFEDPDRRSGNLVGWEQYRKILPHEYHGRFERLLVKSVPQ